MVELFASKIILDGLPFSDVPRTLKQQVADILIINKIDVIPYFDFDLDKVKEYALMINPKLKIFTVSSKTGEGLDEVASYIKAEVQDWIK